MACRYPNPEDAPAVLWMVARREDDWPHSPLYYAGPTVGWVNNIDGGAVWPSVELAAAVAAIFPAAVPMRVLVWEPLPVLVHPDDRL